MERLWKRMFGGGSTASSLPVKLQEALEREADKPGHGPAWYKVQAIYVKKENPITDYRIVLSEENPPP